MLKSPDMTISASLRICSSRNVVNSVRKVGSESDGGRYITAMRVVNAFVATETMSCSNEA